MNNKILPNQIILSEGYFFTAEKLNDFIHEIINHTLNIAALTAEVEDIGGPDRDGNWQPYDIVNQESITDNLESIYQKFKV